MVGVEAERRKQYMQKMEKVFKNYEEVSESKLEGLTIAKAYIGINAMDTGVMLELERQIDNVTIGVDVIYDPDCEEGGPTFSVSDEYVKNIRQIPEEPEKKIKIRSVTDLSDNGKSSDFMSLEEFKTMMDELNAAEIERLGVGSREFQERHQEIMDMIGDVQEYQEKEGSV